MNFAKTSFHKPLSLVALACLALGCPGRLADPERFVGASPDGSSSVCSISADMVETQLLRRRCATSECHSRTVRSGGLDLESPDIAARVLGVASATCSDQTLLNPGDGTGFLLDKLGPSPACGDRMPQGAPPLSAGDMTCLRSWAASLRTDAGAPDVPVDIPADVRPVDVMTDARPMDAPTDTAPTDISSDTRPVDAPADARPDVIDVPADTAMDAGIDVAPDVAADVRSDVIDAGVDARSDVSDDAAEASDTVDAEDVSEGVDD